LLSNEIVNFLIIPAASSRLTLICTVASDIPICFAISTNGRDESLFRMLMILRLISSITSWLAVKSKTKL
jgi:hypothetical protein